MISLLKPVIVCIVGPSGSGKTTMAQHISKHLHYHNLVSYTTRPKRNSETNGVEHWFVTEDEMPPCNQMLAYTQFGDHHYWVPVSDIPNEGICLYVIDEDGVRFLEENYKDDYYIFTVLIKRNISLLVRDVGTDRVMRDLERNLIPEEEYSLVIENNGSLQAFLDNSLELFKSIFE